MNARIFSLLLLVLFVSIFLSGCTNAESKSSEEVVIDSSSNGSSNEVYITNADVKSENQQISTTQISAQNESTILSDNSKVETLVDGFGNRTQTRYFPGHPRLRLLILRTSAAGKQEVTVYGNAGDTKIVPDLGDKALTASGDEIANAAQLFATSSYGGAKNFMKRSKTESQTPLQPLPSSSFQKPTVQYNQPVETVQNESNNSRENTDVQQNNPDED